MQQDLGAVGIAIEQLDVGALENDFPAGGEA